MSLTSMLSYGNYIGPGNKILEENAGYVEEQRRRDPNYNEVRDPRFQTDRYKPIDALDAAGRDHDSGYSDHLHGQSMFSWNGMNAVKNDDRALANATDKELGQNGSHYSDKTRTLASGMEGFFGGRAMGLDAVNWVGNKAGEAQSGIAGFMNGAQHWGSAHDAAAGMGSGLHSAASWMAKTGGEAAAGIGDAAHRTAGLGGFGMATTAAGLANVAGAGLAHLGSEAAHGVAGAGKHLVGGLFDHFAD
jgi:hypothetical protein